MGIICKIYIKCDLIKEGYTSGIVYDRVCNKGGKMLRSAGKILSFAVPFLMLGAATDAHAFGGLPGGLGGFFGGGGGGGQSMGGVVANTVFSADELPALLSAICYMIGLTLGVMGIIKIYEHVNDPRSTHVSEGPKRLLVGGGLLALPIVVEAAYITMAGEDGEAIELSGFSGQATGDGLDAMMARLMNDMHDPLIFAMNAFCYMAGMILVVVGVLRLLKSSQEGPRGPGGAGTLMTFIVAGALLSVDAMMGAWSNSMFSTNNVANTSVLAYSAGLTGEEERHILGVISTILIFMMILGWISFIRGWFIIRDVAEGNNNASLMAGITHLIGGALAVNLGPLMNAVQETLGLTAYGVNFTM